MTEALEQQREDLIEATAQLPSDAPIGTAPASSDSWDDVQALLDDFDRKTATPEPSNEADGNVPHENVSTDQSLDQQIADLLGPDPRIGELQNEINGLRSQEIERQSRADFESFAGKLQAALGSPNLPDDYARTQLLAAATERPELQIAWQHRHITDEQIAAADREFRGLELLYNRAVNAPDDGRKASALRAMEARGQQLGYMLNARTMLNALWRDVQKRASKVAPQIDIEATADRDMIAQSIRDGQGPIDVKEPAPDFAHMSDREFNEWIRKNIK